MKDEKQIKREKEFFDLLQEAKKHLQGSLDDSYLDQIAIIDDERPAIPFPYGTRHASSKGWSY